MRKYYLCVFAGFERQQAYASGEFIEDVFLNYARYKLVDLFGTAVDLCGLSVSLMRFG